MKHKIKSATAVYTGGGIYIYYGQLESGLWFRAWDECEAAYICDSDTEAEEADYPEFYDTHTIEEITGDEFRDFWNAILSHVLNGGEVYGKWLNYDPTDLERRLFRPATPPTSEELQERIGWALEMELSKIYDELEIDSGDISPLDSLEWDRLTTETAELFKRLIKWNANDE